MLTIPLPRSRALLSSLGAQAPVLSAYTAALLALSPSGYWPLDEAAGTATFADSSGNGLTATGSGTYLAGTPGIVPNHSNKNAVRWPLLGQAVLASSTTFDYTSLQPFSFVVTATTVTSALTQFLYSKYDGAASTGHYLLITGTTMQFGYATNASNLRIYAFPLPLPGVHQIIVSYGGSAAVAPNIWVDDVLQTLTPTITGTPANISTASVFRLGGRADGRFLDGFMQDAAFFSGKALSSGEAAALWAAHQTVYAAAAIPCILDTDGGSGDKGDLAMLASTIYRHRLGQINLLGVMVTCGDDFTAPATRAILDFYGLTAIPVGAYKDTDAHVDGGAGTPARLIRDRDRPADDRTNAIYKAPETFYNDILSAQANNSVVVCTGGFINSIAKFLNASAANKTLWNAKVRQATLHGGQYPNTSTAAAPAGNYLSTGPGNWNFGGSDAGTTGPGIAEAQAVADFITHSTVLHYWHGSDLCGNTGNSPILAEFVNSDIPSAWPTTNPIRYGWGTGTRTAWDIMADTASFQLALMGTNNSYWSLNQINPPVFDVAGLDHGQMTTTTGTTNNYYLTPKLGALTLAQWRTLMTAVLNVTIPAPV